jgi:hypothetical protein
MPKGIPDWRRTDRGDALTRLSDRVDRVVAAPLNKVLGGRPLTDSAKRKLLKEGIEGSATILEAPGSASAAGEAWLRFKVRIEIPGREPYEVTLNQTGGEHAVATMQPPAVVECRVSPDNPNRLVLLPPLDDTRLESSDHDLEHGKRTSATVVESGRTDKTAPGSGHPIYVFKLAIDAEGRRWEVTYGQRVPPGAEQFTAAGSKVVVAYTAIDDSTAVSIDWDATVAG